jgi:carbon-monoxide dehydrogenase medium subunit
MKPAPFSYVSPTKLKQALEILDRPSGQPKPIAGGQSLLPMLNLRLARPEQLMGLWRVPELKSCYDSSQTLRVGAGMTHAEIEDSIVPDVTRGYMAYVAKGIAYRAVRNRGTIGGSLCHADPAADWISALSALGARCEVQGGLEPKWIPVENFILAPLICCLEPHELLVSVAIPKLSNQTRWAYVKLCRKAGEFAKSICAIVWDPELKHLRIVVGATDGAPVILHQAAEELSRGHLAKVTETAHAELSTLLPDSDPVHLRQHQAMIEKAIRRILEQNDA